MVNEPTINESSQNLKSPSPPRWRFVKEAKSTAGYSSLSAGICVAGLSSEELAMKYTPPPDVDLPKKKTVERRDVGKLDTKELESAFTPRRIVNAIDDSTQDCGNRRESGPVIVEDNIGDIETGCSVQGVDPSGGEENETEIETKPTETTDGDEEDALVDIPLEQEAEAEIMNYESPADKDEGSTGKEQICDFTKKQKVCLLLLLLSLLVIAITLGLSLGNNETDTRNEKQTAETTVWSVMSSTASPSEPPSTFPASLIQTENPSSSKYASSSPSQTPSSNLSSFQPTHSSMTPSQEHSSMSPTNSPSVGYEQIDGYLFKGTGFCVDSKGYRYDSYYKTNFGTPSNCGALCIKDGAFRGLVIEEEQRCRCLYEDGLLALVSGTYNGYGVTFGGIGEVMTADKSANAKCYKYQG